MSEPTTNTKHVRTEVINATPAYELPDGHLFRLIYFGSQAVDSGSVDTAAVLARLSTEEGQAEIRQWVEIKELNNKVTRLFLHQFLRFDIGWTDGEWWVAPNHRPFYAIDGDAGMEILRRAVEAYPEAVGVADSEGYYPLHHICSRKTSFTVGGPIPWRPETRQIFNFLYNMYPEVIDKIAGGSNQETLLHCMFRTRNFASLPNEPGRSVSSKTVFNGILDFVLDASPNLCEVPNSYGNLPLHDATMPLKHDSAELIKKVLPLCSKAAAIIDWNNHRHPRQLKGQTILHAILEGCHCGMSKQVAAVVDAFLSILPLEILSKEDTRLLHIGKYDPTAAMEGNGSYQRILPSGDALDYICAMYTRILNGVWWHRHGDYDPENHAERYSMRPYGGGGFVATNEDYLNTRADRGPDDRYMPIPFSPENEHSMIEDQIPRSEPMFSCLLRILRIFGESNAPTHLHAFLQHRTCRPWYLAVIDQILTRYPDEARVTDENGHLPLHLYLLSCMAEMPRAIEKGYAEDKKDYCKAVALCFKLLLDANPEAAQTVDVNGVCPLLLAIKHCNAVQYSGIAEPLLNLSPRTLLARDAGTRLHPFAVAGVEANSNFNTSFQLLRRDPAVLAILGFF